MKSLIVQTNSDGSQRRCDAKCTEATGSACKCICGGVNHGVGYSQAEENVTKYIESLFPDREDLKFLKDPDPIVDPCGPGKISSDNQAVKISADRQLSFYDTVGFHI
jgi:hypothetical protein